MTSPDQNPQLPLDLETHSPDSEVDPEGVVDPTRVIAQMRDKLGAEGLPAGYHRRMDGDTIRNVASRSRQE